MTSVSSNTILSSTSSLFTLILSIFVLRIEKFQFTKIFGVLLAFGGVVLVSLTDNDGSNGKDTLFGDLLALFSACTYAVYVSLYKKAVKDDEHFDNTLFLGNAYFFVT
jgi:solute carrier family 35 protein F5